VIGRLDSSLAGRFGCDVVCGPAQGWAENEDQVVRFEALWRFQHGHSSEDSIEDVVSPRV
ncbi:unnamed protein product, partial [Scytosiphon promiscuus]